MARILYIEDDPASRLLVRKLLTAAGHEVSDAGTGLEGIREAQRHRPDLVLVDINVPDLDGYEITLRLRGMTGMASVPIVAITAEGDRETSIAVGADGFLSKPIDAGRFARTIERFLRGHREQGSSRGPDKLRAQSQEMAAHLEARVTALIDANARLEELARLRREFLQNTTHELATPLTPIVGYLRLVLDGELGPLTPQQHKALFAMEQSMTRLRGVVDTLVDVSALESGRMSFRKQEYDFAELARAAVEKVRPLAAARGQAIAMTAPSARCGATGDAEKLGRAMAHVLDNALKFTPSDGEIAVEATARDGAYCFDVADTGPGVAGALRERILEPFFQVDGSTTRTFGGVGLGLAFARRVCEGLGGGVIVESPPGRAVAGRHLRGTLVTLRVRP